MDDWQYQVYCRILQGSEAPFDVPDVPQLSRHQKNSHRRVAKANFCLIDGKLYQRVKFNETVQVSLKPVEQMAETPVIGVDFILQKQKNSKLVPVAKASEKQQWLRRAHDENGHQGRDATLKFLRGSIHWHGVKSDVSDHIRVCDTCQRTRTDYTVAPLQHIIPEKPNVRWQIDFTTVAGHQGYLLIVIDCFSKHVWFKWLPTKESSGVTAFLLSIFKKEGQRPKIIQSDNGGEFISEAMNQIAAEFNIEIIHGRPCHPQSQGNVERVNKTIKAMLYKLIRAAKEQNRPYSVSKLIENVIDIYNNSSHSSTGFTPLELQRPVLLSPTHAQTPREILAEQRLQLAGLFARAHEQLQRAAQKADKVHNKKYSTKIRIFKVGDRVLYKIPKQLRKKGQPGYDCEAEVVTVHRNSRYSLKFTSNAPPNSNRTFNANEFKLYYANPLNNNSDEQEPEVVAEPSNEPKSQDEDSELFEVNYSAESTSDDNTADNNHNAEGDYVEYSLSLSDVEVENQLALLLESEEEPSAQENNTNVMVSSAHEESSVSEPDYLTYRPKPRGQIARKPGVSECHQFRLLGSPKK